MASTSTRSTLGGTRRYPALSLDYKGRKFLQVSPRDAFLIYGKVTVLRAHRDGRSIRRSEVKGRPWRLVTKICGVLLCTERGALMVQFRGWPEVSA